MSSKAVVQIEGNLGADPELKITPNGKSVTKFSVAVQPRIKVGDEWQDGDLVWYRVSLWGRQAENAVEALRKGVTVVVGGDLTVGEYEKDGVKKFSLDVRGDYYGIVPKNIGAGKEVKDEFPW